MGQTHLGNYFLINQNGLINMRVINPLYSRISSTLRGRGLYMVWASQSSTYIRNEARNIKDGFLLQIQALQHAMHKALVRELCLVSFPTIKMGLIITLTSEDYGKYSVVLAKSP